MNKSSLNIKSGGIIAIVIILLAEYMIFPWFDWVEETRLSIISQQSTLAKQERLISKAEALEAQRDVLSVEYIDKLAGFQIIEKKQDSAIMWLKEVESHLAKYTLTVNRKSPTREVNINDDLAVYVGKVNVKGSYGEVLNFVEKLENDKLGNRVRQLRLISNKATPDIATADVEFIKVFKRS